MIPESVRIGGTFRSLSNEGLLYIQRRIKEVLCVVFQSPNLNSESYRLASDCNKKGVRKEVKN